MIYVWYENRDNLLILKNIEKWKKSTILFPKMLSGKDTFIASYTAPTQSSEAFRHYSTVVDSHQYCNYHDGKCSEAG
jgi:hypothetical protein